MQGQKNSVRLSGIEPRFLGRPTRSLLPIMTELYRSRMAVIKCKQVNWFLKSACICYKPYQWPVWKCVLNSNVNRFLNLISCRAKTPTFLKISVKWLHTILLKQNYFEAARKLGSTYCLGFITWDLEGISGMRIVGVGISAWLDCVHQRLLSVQKHLSSTHYRKLFSAVRAANVFGIGVFIDSLYTRTGIDLKPPVSFFAPVCPYSSPHKSQVLSPRLYVVSLYNAPKNN
jgi:hypothetical protein